MKDSNITVTWEVEEDIEKYESSQFIYETSGDVFIQDGDIQSGEKLHIAKFTTYFANCSGARKERADLLEVFDAHSQNMYEYYAAIYDPRHPRFKQRLQNLFNWPISGNNLFVVDRLEILPEFRGYGFGLKIIDFLIARLGLGAGLVAIKPYPLQFETNVGKYDQEWTSKMRLGDLSKNEKQAFKILQDYYSKLGFIKFPKTPYMVRRV